MSTILIGVDATARSEDAVALARQLALTLTGDLVVAAITHDRAEGDATVRRMAGLLDRASSPSASAPPCSPPPPPPRACTSWPRRRPRT